MAVATIKMEKKAGKPNLEKLLLPTEHHPKGRIQIDPETGTVKAPKNNVIGHQQVILRHESGAEIGRVERPINGGHVCADGSVWRLGLGGPAKYHWQVVNDEWRFRVKGKGSNAATELEYVEAKEYQDFLDYLKSEKLSKELKEQFEGQKMTPELKEEFKEVNKAFYAFASKPVKAPKKD